MGREEGGSSSRSCVHEEIDAADALVIQPLVAFLADQGLTELVDILDDTAADEAEAQAAEPDLQALQLEEPSSEAR